MKKLLTIDDIMIAFVTALGYGYGEIVAGLFGWPRPACLVVSIVVGIVLEAIVNKIVFSEAVQKKPMNRILIYVAFILIFLIAHSVAVARLGVSMLDYLVEQFIYVIGLPILVFIVKLIIRAWRERKIRERYGDGSEGYVFDVKKEDVEEINRQNRPVPGAYDTDLAVKTRTGIYVGEKYKKAICYLGIPYAKPPVGDLLWKAPEPLPASDAVFEAGNFGASAIQVDHKGSILKHHRQSEDCLNLNIFIGCNKPEDKCPVLVMFHHGDFSFGGSADPLLYGTDFVAGHPDTVFVSFDYRLGIFGFIDFSEIPGGEAYPDALNLGLLDQIAALRWIRENIAAFGGDPYRVTVLGFEAGASSICLLAASEQAKGLFQRAFVCNGSPISAYDSPEAAKALAGKLLAETKTSSMEELLQLKPETLKDATQRLWQNMCAPTCDGKLIPHDVYHACQDGGAKGIEFIICFSDSEMQVYRSFIGEQNYKEAISAAMDDLQKSVDASVAKAIRAYMEQQTNASTEPEAKSRLLDQWNGLCMYYLAEKLSEGGNQVYLMNWNKKPLIEKLGSGSVDIEAVLLGNSDALQMYGNVMNADLSEILQSLLIKFMSGNALQLYPNEIKGVDAIEWEPFPKMLIVSDDDILCVTSGTGMEKDSAGEGEKSC